MASVYILTPVRSGWALWSTCWQCGALREATGKVLHYIDIGRARSAQGCACMHSTAQAIKVR